MTKNILLFTIVATLLTSMPMVAVASQRIEIMDVADIENDKISIALENNSLRIGGASGEVLRVFNITGVCVMAVKVDGDDKRIDLNLSRGCYIIKVGKVARKINIR